MVRDVGWSYQDLVGLSGPLLKAAVGSVMAGGRGVLWVAGGALDTSCLACSTCGYN